MLVGVEFDCYPLPTACRDAFAHCSILITNGRRLRQFLTNICDELSLDESLSSDDQKSAQFR